MKQESGGGRARQQSDLVDPAINRVLTAEMHAREVVAECERRAAAMAIRAEERCRRVSQRAERRMQRAQQIADQGIERALAELRAPLEAGTDASVDPGDARILMLASALIEELLELRSTPSAADARPDDEARA
jgi:hypothetical protein